MISPEYISTLLYSAEGSRQLDSLAIDNHGVPGYTLMTRAARSAYYVLVARWPRARHIVLLSGPGNNGGDAYVLARMLKESGRRSEIVSLGAPRTSDCIKAANDYLEVGGTVVEYSGQLLDADVLVDGMLGTGIEREVGGTYLEAVQGVNQSLSPVLALDIPSGIHADRGVPMGAAVIANATVTFIGKKFGLYTGAATNFTGQVHYADLGVPPEIFEQVPVMAKVIQPSLPVRDQDSHKGSYGRLLVMGGNSGMGGAATMAGMAALKTGAGLVRVATHPEHASTIGTEWPEIMVEGVADLSTTRHWVNLASALVLGPGLGQGDWSNKIFSAADCAGLPCIVDADGLYLLTRGADDNQNRILTPHPGEAAMLLSCSTAEIQANRYAAALELQSEYGGTVVLKGAGTLVASGDGIWLCDHGNPGMATAGMGDILSGVIGGLLAQGFTPPEAARTGTWLHARAGDMATSEVSEAGLVATDLLPWIALLSEQEMHD